jgi:large subunit ribosomal protein L21
MAMYAIIETDGKQLRVSEGDTIRCDAIEREVGSEISFDKVLLTGGPLQATVVGSPALNGARVIGTVLRQAKDKKILVFKYKPKKRVRKLVGHRQRFAEVRITKIEPPSA